MAAILGLIDLIYIELYSVNSPKNFDLKKTSIRK